MPSIRLRVPSKINLHLRVAAPDATGFHPLRSWFVTTSLCDTLACVVEDGPRRVTLRCDEPTIPTDGRNLVVRAAERWLDAAGVEASIAFELTKRVPHGAGLGGGSADAAATLVALDTLLGEALGERRPALAPIAASLGSDVPFFLGPPSAVATGRGEILAAAPSPAAGCAVLLLPPFGVSTPECYRALDAMRPAAATDTLAPFDVDAWSRLPAAELAGRLVNDLESPAFAIRPELGRLRDAAERAAGRPVRMSGSGSALFALYDTLDEAREATERLRAIAHDARLECVTIASSAVAPEPSPDQ